VAVVDVVRYRRSPWICRKHGDPDLPAQPVRAGPVGLARPSRPVGGVRADHLSDMGIVFTDEAESGQLRPDIANILTRGRPRNCRRADPLHLQHPGGDPGYMVDDVSIDVHVTASPIKNWKLQTDRLRNNLLIVEDGMDPSRPVWVSRHDFDRIIDAVRTVV
jgi:hypothetical protein